LIDFGFGNTLTDIVKKDIQTTLDEFQKREKRFQSKGKWTLSQSIETGFQLLVQETPSCAIAFQNED
jgi:hypothetical protein